MSTSTLEDKSFLLTGISWEHYEAMLAMLADRPVRLTYDRGCLELMSPSFNHERLKKRLARLVEVLTEELNIPLVAGGSTTFKRRDLERGLEPDECFYIQNASRVQGKQVLDLATDPPPDLVIEIDFTSSSLNRLDIYAALGVPEVWRYANDRLKVYRLDLDGKFQEQERSGVFEFLLPSDLIALLEQFEQSTDTELARVYRSSLRPNPSVDHS